MTPEIRPITPDEVESYIDTMGTGFLERPDVAKVAAEVRPIWDLSRAWAAFDGRMVGTLRTWATEITAPGGARVPMAAVAAVTVLPTHRRRGILSGMIAAEHAAARERDEAVAGLYASEYPIYGRFGYGPACRSGTWTVDALATSMTGGSCGGVELATPGEAARDAIRGVFERHRARQPGELRRRDFRWDADLGLRDSSWGPRWSGFLALHRDASGEVDGYVRYRAEEKWEQRQPRNVLAIQELHALTDDAYAALWRFCLDVDLVSTVKAEGRPVEERLPWLLTNARAASLSDVGDGLWVRLLDVPRALEARGYEREGRLVLEVIDAEARGGRLKLALEAGPDGASCRRTAAGPDLTLDVRALGAAWLGGARLADAALATGVDEHRAGALAEATALLRTAAEPWCSTFF